MGIGTVVDLRVDWITVTSLDDAPYLAYMDWVLATRHDQLFDIGSPSSRPICGYGRVVSSGAGYICCCDGPSERPWLLQFSGSYLSLLASYSTVDILILLAGVLGARFTRVDVAIDHHCPPEVMDSLISSCERNELCGARSWTLVASHGRTGGRTVYLGSPSSDYRVRFYEKSLQMGVYHDSCLRWEAVFRGECAAALAERVIGLSVDGATGQLHAAAVTGRYSFRLRSDGPSDYSRRPLVGWWRDFIAKVPVCRFVPPSYGSPTYRGWAEWMRRSVFARYCRMAAHCRNRGMRVAAEDLLLSDFRSMSSEESDASMKALDHEILQNILRRGR